MASARARVLEQFGVVLEPEVQLLGDVAWPDAWTTVTVNAQVQPQSTQPSSEG